MAGEQERADMIEQLRERLVELLHTKEGSRVAMQCIWHGTAKVYGILKYIPGAPNTTMHDAMLVGHHLALVHGNSL